MKMNRFFMGASLCALMFAAVGCSSDDDSSDNRKVAINATAEIKNIGDSDASQRVVLGGANDVSPLWETDDQIAVKVDGGTANTLTLSSGATTQHGVFNGDIPASGTTMTAYYPASAATVASGATVATDLTTQTGTVEAAAKASVMFATANYSASPKFNFANKTSILSFSMAVPTGFNPSGTLTATVFGAYSKGTLGTDGSWTGTVATPIKVSEITVSGDNKINGYVVVIPGSNVNVLSIVVSDGTSSYQTAAYTSATATIAANKIISITKGLAEKEYVDLGLPSGLLWATTNIGATNPEDYGTYYAWGETATKTDYSWATYKFGTQSNLTKYYATDGKTVLEAADDAATANWGSNWRMPTQAEIDELLDNTTEEWTTVNGVDGRKFTSTVTGHTDKSIFFPAAGYRDGSGLDYAGSRGYYWSSSLSSGNANYAYDLYFSSGNAFKGSGSRCNGFPVRPVRAN